MKTPPERLRALLAEPGFVVMPAVWDGLSAKLSAAAGFTTAFLSGSCVAASRLGGPDLDLISFGEMQDSFNMVRGAAPDTLVLADGDHGYGNPMNVMRTDQSLRAQGSCCSNRTAARQITHALWPSSFMVRRASGQSKNVTRAVACRHRINNQRNVARGDHGARIKRMLMLVHGIAHGAVYSDSGIESFGFEFVVKFLISHKVLSDF